MRDIYLRVPGPFFMTMESSRSVFSIVGELKISQYFSEESSLKVWGFCRKLTVTPQQYPLGPGCRLPPQKAVQRKKEGFYVWDSESNH